MIPESLVVGVSEAEFKGDAAKHQREQHHQDREINGWNYDCEGERKRGKKAEAAEDEPRLVAVPNGCDRVHDRVTGPRIWCKPVEHANAEIESIEQNVEEHRQSKDERPDRNKVEGLVHRASPVTGMTAPARTGASGRPASIFESTTSVAPLRIKRSIKKRPVG